MVNHFKIGIKMSKTIITCAISGAETTREHNPAVPITPAEIADAAKGVCDAGASILHLHVRDENGEPTQDVEIFRQAIELIRGKCDIVIEITTGGAVGMTVEERMAPLVLEPEMASLDCGTCNFGDEYIVNTLPDMKSFARQMQKLGIRPTLECFDVSHIDSSKILIEEGLVTEPFHYGLVLNVPGGIRYDEQTLRFMVDRLPQNSFWTTIGIGGRISEQKIADSMDNDGFVRVGFEDNVFFSKGQLAVSNAQLVERAVSTAKDRGLAIATPSDVRGMFKLKG
jgi:3-keto-5-aminohexanoate cleavage enzyme